MSEQLPGVVQHSNAKTIYWSIMGGQLARKVDASFEGAKMRTNKAGVQVWEELTRALMGKIRDVNVFENTFDNKKIKQLVIKLIPKDGWLYVINIPVQSRYYGSFLEKLPNILLKDSVEIAPYDFEDEKTKRKNQGITIKQNDVKLQSYYKVKEGEKYVYINGFPPFPAEWNKLAEREKKNYFYDVDDFFTSELNKWRIKNAPDYEKEREQTSENLADDLAASSDLNSTLPF
jgi:hypothetical protein